MERGKLFILCLFLIFISCNNEKTHQKKILTNSNYAVEYARGFVVSKQANYTEIDVRDPWDTTHVLQRYILVDKNIKLPSDLPKGKLVRTPLTRIGVSSTIHCSSLQELNALSIIKGVCEPSYIDIDSIQQGVKSNQIIDLGQGKAINVEKAILLNPEALFVTPIQGQPYGSIERSGITMIETPDYMEATPLARAEWIRFYSLFVGKELLADSLFATTVNSYKTIKNKVAQTINRPSVFLDTKYGNTWYTAGGESYMANLLKDAGAHFVFADNEKTGAIPLSFETVLDRAKSANFWLIKYNSPEDLTYNRLASEYQSYTFFDAFKQQNIYECNTNKYNYYEDLPIHPDWILIDFAFIFHPEIFPDYKPRYYKKMQN